jgi:hypothetical protein
MRIPSDFLTFSETEPLARECVSKVMVKGIWAVLKKPITQWPQTLFSEYQQDLYFLFPDEFKTENYNSKDVICLCCTIENCPKKPAGEIEHRSCDQYRRGLCIEASVEANDCEPLALGSIARFHGLSKQRVHQIYNSARKRLILELSQDQLVQEYLADVFLGKQSMPSPDEIATFIEKAMSGNAPVEDIPEKETPTEMVE